MSAAENKDTIYIDVDEEITGIVNKIQNSPKNIVALVLPKKADVFQSVVNMKLLKRSAEQADKKIVLVTSENKILPLAGAAGLFVAANSTSKPYVPLSPSEPGYTNPNDPNTPGEELASNTKNDDDGIEIDNTKPSVSDPSKSAKKSSDKNKKVPNFSSFRKKMIIVAAGIFGLIIFLVWAIVFAPSATVNVKANTNEVPVNLELSADTDAESSDPSAKIVRATKTELVKEDSEKVLATGEKDNGNKASGTVELKNCTQKDGKISLPAGTGMSSGEFTFLTTAAVTLDSSVFSGGGTCLSPTKEVPVIAQEPGEKYNLSARDYTVAGNGGVEASGSTMSGGTSDKVKVVSQADIDKAKERLNSKQNTAQEELKQQLAQGGFIGVDDSFSAGTPKYTSNPAVNTEAAEVTVTAKTTSSMLGVNRDDVKAAIDAEVKNSDEGSEQTILSDGIDTAQFSLLANNKNIYTVSVASTVVVGPDVDEELIKQQIQGKKSAEAEQFINNIAGFSDTEINLSPFWVGSVPKPEKVELEIQQTDGTTIQ